MHNCKALVITCMDFRLVRQTGKYLADLGLENNYDLLSVAGSTKDLVAGDEKIKDFFFRNINVSCALHSARQVFIIHHSDCGAYGGSAAFASAEKEKEFQISEMQKSEAVIKEKFPQFEIKKIYAIIKEGGAIEFDEIK